MKWNLRLNKRYIAIFTCAGVLLSGGMAAFARHHIVPGVDRPFDPANYWTHDTISWPDSAPSPYTLKDIANNGGQIIDYQNLPQNTIKDVKAVAEFTQRLKELVTKIQDLAKLGGDPLDSVGRLFAATHDDSSIVEQAEKSALHLADGGDHSSAQVLAKGLRDKYTYLDEAYRSAYSYAKAESGAFSARADVLREAAARIETVEGRLAAAQSQAEIGAVTAAGAQARNRLIAQRNALLALHGRAVNDEIVRAETVIRTKLNMKFADPYHYNSYDRAIYEKPKGNTMPNFAD